MISQMIPIPQRRGRPERPDPLLPDAQDRGPAERRLDRMRPFVDQVPRAGDEAAVVAMLARVGLRLQARNEKEGTVKPKSGSRFPYIINVTDRAVPPPSEGNDQLFAAWGRPVALFSDVGKMPGASFNLPAGKPEEDGVCGVAALKFENNICDTCYALAGQYMNARNQRVAWQRLAWVERLLDHYGPDQAAVFMAVALRWMARERIAYRARTELRFSYFRLHDAGEFYSQSYAEFWVNVAALLTLTSPPEMHIWVPTRVWASAMNKYPDEPERWRLYPLLATLIEGNALPSLTVRPSAVSTNVPPPEIVGLSPGSGVQFILTGKKKGKRSDKTVPPPPPRPAGGDVCIAPGQDDKCWGKVQCSECWHRTKVIWYVEHAQDEMGGTPAMRKEVARVRKFVQVRNRPGALVNRRQPDPQSLWMVMDKKSHKVFYRSWSDVEAARGWARSINGLVVHIGSGQITNLEGTCVGRMVGVA